MDLAVLTPNRPGGRPDRRPEGDRARRRRRPRHDRPGHRRRLHLRQGDRVGHPPARDARGDHEHPVARLRPDRGDRLLRVHLRPDRVLPLGGAASATSCSCAQRRGGQRRRQLPRQPERRADDLDAARVRDHPVPAEQAGLPAHRRGARQAPPGDRGVDRRTPSAPSARPTSCSRSTAPGCARPASRPRTSSSARARPPTRWPTRPRRRPPSSARSCWRPPGATSRPRRAARSTRSARRSPTSR